MSVELCFVFITSFLIRYLPTIFAPVGHDTYGHLCFAKAVRHQRTGPFGTLSLPVIGSSSFARPFLWHWCFSVFDERFLLKNQKFINPIIDAGFAVVVYYIAPLYVGTESGAAATVWLLYLLSPITFTGLAIGPRVNTLTPRLASEIAANGMFLFLLNPSLTDGRLSLLGASLFLSLLLGLGKFGNQVAVFILPLYSLISVTTGPIIVLVSGAVLILGISRGRIVESWRQQLEHLKWYFKANNDGKVGVSMRNSVRRLFSATENTRTFKTHCLLVVRRAIGMNSYTGVFLKMPVLVVGVALMTVFLSSDVEMVSMEGSSALVVASIVVYLITSTRRFLFLGEAERYLSHAIVPIVLWASTLISQFSLGSLINVGLIGYGVVFWLLEVLGGRKLVYLQAEKEEIIRDEVLPYLNGLEPKRKVLLYGYEAVSVYRVMLETQHYVFFPMLARKEVHDQMIKLQEVHPFVKLESLGTIQREYGVNILILSREDLKRRGHSEWNPGPEWKELDIGREFFRIFVFVESDSGIGGIPTGDGNAGPD